MTSTNVPDTLPPAQARSRDVDRRQQRIHQALVDMHADKVEISFSAVAARTRQPQQLRISYVESDGRGNHLAAAGREIGVPATAALLLIIDVKQKTGAVLVGKAFDAQWCPAIG